MENLTDRVVEAMEKASDYYSQLIDEHLCDGESLLYFCDAERKLPFLLRILPFVPSAPKKYLLVVTTKRVLALRMKLRMFKDPIVRSVEASAELPQITSITPRTGILTSSISLQLRDGTRLRYTDMLRSAAGEFAAMVEEAKADGAETDTLVMMGA